MSGSMTVDQDRQPSGRPEGGQWTERARQGADVSLSELSDADYNAEGTYIFPPRPRSVAQHIAFWESVPIPEDIMIQVAEAHAVRREVMIQQYCSDAVDEWKKENPDPTDNVALTIAKKKKPKASELPYLAAQWEAAAREVWDEAEARAEKERPAIPVFDMRTVLRAHRMYEDACDVMPGERAAEVAEHLMPFGDGEARVVDIYDAFKLWEINSVTRGIKPPPE